MVQANMDTASSYSSIQRAVSLTMGLASSLSLSTVAALANGQMPQTHMAHPGWQPPSGAPATHSGSPFGHFGWQGSSAGSTAQAAVVPNSFAQHSSISHSSAFAAIHNPAASFQRFAGAAPASTRDLNLASPARSFVAGNLANFKELTIQIGGSQQVVTMDTKLSAAEMVAAQQVLTGGNQTIKISASGAATGGTVTLNSNLLTALDTSVGGFIGSLTIARGVQVIDTLSQLTITGNLNNYGSLLTGSTTRGASDNILATTIFNAYGGAIGSYTGGGGLFAADPVLTGTNGIANAGTISSAGNLTLNAPVVYNIATTDNGATTQATISAARNVNINTQQLNNAGIIAALTGNVNVASNAALAVNSAGGVFVADKGNLNFSANNANLTMMGGDYYSKNLNLDAGTATVDTLIGEVSGTVNANASCVHLNAESSLLTLGNINATDDPLFTNAVDLSITGTILPTNGADLTLIAGGSVYGSKGNKGLDTSSKTGKGGNLTVIAGAAFTTDIKTGDVTVTGVGSGGVIDFTAKNAGSSPAAVSTIKSSGSGTFDSGSITMVAYANGIGTGSINTGTATIDTSTKGTGKYGDVLLIAGATTGTGITTGKILANNVTLDTASPDAGVGVIYSSAGTRTSQNFVAGAPTTSTVTLDTVTAKGAVDYELNSPLTINKAISAQNITINTGALNDVTIKAAVGTATTTSVNISGGNIIPATGGVISGVTATLTAGASRSIGTLSGFPAKITYLPLKVQNVSATAGGHVILQETGDLTITSLNSGPAFSTYIKGSANIKQTGNLFGDNVTITSGKSLTLEGKVAASNGTSGINSLQVTAGTTFTQGDALGNGTLLNQGFGSVITAKGAVNILGAVTSTGSLDITTPAAFTLGSATDKTANFKAFFSSLSALTFTNFGTLDSGVVQITATAKDNAIVNNNVMLANSNLSLSTTNAAGAIENNSGASITGKFLNFNTSKIIAFGANSINGSSINIRSTKNLTIVGDTDSFKPVTGEALSINGPDGKAGDFTVLGTSTGQNPFSDMSNMSSFAISFEHGTVTTPLQSMVAHSDAAGSGGDVTLFATKFIYNGAAPFTGPFVMTADGTTSGTSTSGQTLQLFILGGDVNIGNGDNSKNSGGLINNFKIFAAGKSDPRIFLSSSGVLRMDDPATNFVTKSTTTTGNSNQFVQIFGNQGIAINGDLTTKNTDGKYTDLQIITASKLPFVIDNKQSFSTLVNGQTGFNAGEGISGNALSMNNAAGLVNGLAPGQGGLLFGQASIFSDAAKITNNATISTPQFVMLPAGGSVTITNTGAFNTPTTDLDIHSLTGSLTINNSGPSAKYNVTGSFLLYSTSGNVTLSGGATNADIAPMAAKIDIEALKGTIALGTGADNQSIVAMGPGGNGGSIIIKGTALTTGTGGTDVLAPTTVTGTTNGGTIDINLTGTKTLLVGQAGVRLGINNLGTNPGGSIAVKNGGAINVADNNGLDLTSIPNPNTTNLSLVSTKGPLFIYGDGAADITLNKLNNVTISSGSSTAFLMFGAKAGANGFGTSMSVPSQLQAKNVTIINSGAIDASQTIPTANNMTLTATKGAILFASGPQSLAALQDGSGNGGTINVTATGLSFTGTLAVNAAATNTGDGGHVNLNLTGTKGVTIGNTTGSISVDISNNSTQGGSFSLINGGPITADASTGLVLKNVAFGSGTGADLNLTAKGLLFVSNTKNISAIGLHDVTFGSNSKTTFIVQDAPSGGKGNGLNGIGVPAFSADSVSIINSGGNIDYNSTGTQDDPINAHNITLAATGASILFKSTYTLTAQQDAAGNGGNITLSSKTAPWVNLLTLNAAGTTGTGGSISVTVTDTKAVNFSTGPFPLLMHVEAGAGKSGGSISLTTGGALSVDLGSGPGVFNYGANLPGSGLTLKANGVLNVKNLSPSYDTAAFKTLSFTSNSKNAFLTSGALPGTNGIEDVNLGFTADNVSFSNTGGAIYYPSPNPINASASITLNALGDIGKSSEHVQINVSPSITITTGSKGNAYVDIGGSSKILNANVGGSLNITTDGGDYTLGAVAPGQGVKAGSINFNLTELNGDNTHTLTLGNVSTTNGNLTVASEAQNLTIANNALISSNKGNIYLQDLNSSVVNLPQITFKAGSVVHGVGPASNKNQGQVFISIGPTPAINNLSPGNGPYGVATIIQGSFFNSLLYFATTSNTLSGITATDKTDIITSAQRILSFSTTIKNDTTHILMETNVQITADPPMPAVPDAQTLYMTHLANPEVKQMTLSMMQPVTLNTAAGSITTSSINTIQSTNLAPVVEALTINNPVTNAINSSASLLGSISNSNVLTNTSLNANHLSGSVTNVINKAGSNLERQTLETGAKLLAPDVRTIINTPFGDVDIAAGAVALLVSTESGLSVYDLHDTRQGAVAIRTGNRTISLVPGRSAVLTHSSKSFAETNPAQFVGYRKIRNSAVNASHNLYEAEFEIMSMVRGLKPLQSLMASDNAKTRKTMDKMFKTAAILMNLYSGNEPFALIKAPQVTAYAPSDR